jgi:hypothetical protein
MGVAILSGVFSSLQSRPFGASSSNAQPESGYSTPTQSFSLSAPEASLPGKFVATVGREETVRKLQKTLGEIEFVKSGRLGSDGIQVVPGEGNLEAVKGSDVILVCCKPQMVAGILQQDGMQEALEGKLVISICAGVRLDQLKELCPTSTVVVRAMPNTPSKVSLVLAEALLGILTESNTIPDRRRNDCDHSSPFHSTLNPSNFAFPLHPLWSSSVLGRETLRRMYGFGWIRAGVCCPCSGSYG